MRKREEYPYRRERDWEHEYQILDHRLSRVEKDCDDNSTSHKRMHEKIEGLETSDKIMSNKLDQIFDIVKEFQSDMKAIKEKPGKKLDQITMYVIMAIIGSVLTFTAGRIFVP